MLQSRRAVVLKSSARWSWCWTDLFRSSSSRPRRCAAAGRPARAIRRVSDQGTTSTEPLATLDRLSAPDAASRCLRTVAARTHQHTQASSADGAAPTIERSGRRLLASGGRLRGVHAVERAAAPLPAAATARRVVPEHLVCPHRLLAGMRSSSPRSLAAVVQELLAAARSTFVWHGVRPMHVQLCRMASCAAPPCRTRGCRFGLRSCARRHSSRTARPRCARCRPREGR